MTILDTLCIGLYSLRVHQLYGQGVKTQIMDWLHLLASFAKSSLLHPGCGLYYPDGRHVTLLFEYKQQQPTMG